MNKNDDKKLHNSNFLDSLKNAINGIIYATTTQANIKKQLLISVIVMIISLFFDLSRAEFLCLVFSIVLIIFAEMVNTAIETLVDLYTDLYHPKAKIAKDLGAGAVVITTLNAVILAYFLFFQKISTAGMNLLNIVIHSPIHLAFVAILLVLISAVAIRAAATTDKHKIVNRKFMPSGQTMLAFAALIVMWINSDNIIILTLSFIMALMIVENRIENHSKTIPEIIFGACLGILVVLLVYCLTFLKV